MKRMKRVISIILVLMLSIMLVSTFSFAENELPDNPAPGTENSEQEMTDDSELLPSDENNNNASEDETAEEVTDSDIEDDVVENQEDTTNSATIEESNNPDDNKKANAEAVQEAKGSERAVIEIKTIQDLNNVRNGLGKSYILMADLDLSKATSPGGIYYNKGAGWSPIGSSYANDSFTGTFDGNNHVIKGIHSKGNFYGSGLFGYSTGTIKNLTIKDSTFESSYQNIGPIVSTNKGTVENCKVTCKIIADRDNNYRIGGISSYNSNEITGCSFNGTISLTGSCYDRKTETTAGGIVGDNSGDISSCINNGGIVCDISVGVPLIGGVAGDNSGDINGCANNGEINVKTENGDAYTGGVTGRSTSYSVATIENAGNAGSISSNVVNGNSHTGGIVGLNEGIVANCENKSSVSADNKSKNYRLFCGGIAGDGKYRSDDENGGISFCSNEGNVSAIGNEKVMVGGIAGYIYYNYIIDKTKNSGVISGRTHTIEISSITYSGGIVGYMYEAVVQNSYNTGTVKSENVCGGIAGSLECMFSTGVIRQCYNTGTIISQGSAGGICGNSYSIILNCYNVGRIEGSTAGGGIVGFNCVDEYGSDDVKGRLALVYNVGTIKNNDWYYANGIVGGLDEGSVFNDDTICTISYAAPAFYNRGKTRSYSDMLKPGTYETYDFSSVWKMGSGPYKFPILRDVLDADEQNNIDLCKCIKMHPYGAWKTTTEPTATSAGVDSRSCYFCGLTETKTTTPTGNVTILNTIANSAKKTNDVIWDKSKIKGATNYQINWRARGASTWASRNVGNTVRGTTSGLTIGNVYEIRVRPYANDINTSKPVYGSWSNTVYRYFHTTEKIRLTSKSKGTFTMSWKSNPNATSYQVLYTTNSNGSGAAQNIKKANKGSTSITVSDIKVNGKVQKLKSGTTYYVQVREIRNIGGINYIGNISCPVAVKVK